MQQRRSIWDRLSQNISATWKTLLRRAGLDKVNPVYVDLSSEEMSRIGPETTDVKGVYFSDFVEGSNSNHIRYAKDFKKTADTLLTDHAIPLSRISRFYGVEDGKIKVGSLNCFNDSTVVVPVRNKNFGAIAGIEVNGHRSWWERLHIYSPRQYYDLTRAAIDRFRLQRVERKLAKKELRHITEYLNSKGFSGSEPFELSGNVKCHFDKLRDDYERLDKEARDLLYSVDSNHEWNDIDQNRLDSIRSSQDALINEIDELRDYLTRIDDAIISSTVKPRLHLPSFYQVKPDVLSLSFKGPDGAAVYDETLLRCKDAKIVLADSLGHGLFITRLNRLGVNEIKDINLKLKEHPLYPVLVDNGRYSHYQLEAGSYREYIRQDLCRDDKDLFVIGSVSRKHQSIGHGQEQKERREKSRKVFQALNNVSSQVKQSGLKIK